MLTLEHPLKIDKLIPNTSNDGLSISELRLDLIPLQHGLIGSHHLVEGFSNLPLHGTHAEMGKMEYMEHTLLYHFGKTCGNSNLPCGAMTIVEIIDHFNGFQTFKSMISTRKSPNSFGLFVFFAFILSAIIDNLTATIVLITILRKIIKDKRAQNVVCRNDHYCR